VSSPLVHSGQKPRDSEWARLIPGQTPAFRGGARKQPQSVRTLTIDDVKTSREPVAGFPENVLTLLVPGPLQSWTAWEWLRSLFSDFALITLDWLLIGALLVPLHESFPRVRSFGYAAGAPLSLLGIALLHAALITLVAHTEGMYAESRAPARILGKAVVLATIVLCLAYGLQGAPWTTSGLFCAAGLLHFGTLWFWRCRSQEREHPTRARADARNVLIVGAGGVGRRVAAYVEQHPAAGRRVCGFLDNERPLGDGVIGRVADLARLARKEFIDEVILAAPHNRDLALEVLREARRLRLDLEIVPELFGCKPTGRETERVDGLPVICLHAERLPAAGLVLKRLTDVAFAGVALAMLAPLLAVIAILIKLDSRGAVLYCAQRAGRKGRLFRCCKFRTMVSNADELKEALRKANQRAGPTFKIARDPRITRVGHYLRRYSLDELPQLWNVVKGEMSLVGPRPHPVDEFAAYEIEHLARLDVTPGITGLWQVTARRDPSFQRGMELDREYIRTWSLTSDLRILLRTFLAVTRGSGE
jgi:exopolysaccharide biosynthesis polyprenyl glycosylphosphotransferase